MPRKNRAGNRHGWNGPNTRLPPRVAESPLLGESREGHPIRIPSSTPVPVESALRTSPQGRVRTGPVEISDAAFAQPVAMQPSFRTLCFATERARKIRAPAKIIRHAADSQRRDPQHSDVSTVQASAPSTAPAKIFVATTIPAVRPGPVGMTQANRPTGGGFSLPGDSLAWGLTAWGITSGNGVSRFHGATRQRTQK